jgi:hypothetical protein
MPRKRSLEVNLVGGLGNQLFGYYAGLYFQTQLKSDLTLNFNGIMQGKFGDSDIRSFKLCAQNIRENRNFNLGIARYHRKVRDKLILEAQVFTNIFYPRTEIIQDTYSFGENPDGKKSKFLAKGYFGNFEYFNAVSSRYPKLELRNPSRDFKKASERATREQPIVVHIRRGDYTNHKNIYGLLGEEYYSNAIRIANDYVGSQPIWIFSDDLEVAKDMTEHIGVKARYIELEFNLSAPESLLLQSMGSVNISANSTYSAWAAALNTDSNIKICPDTYFIDNRITPHWPPAEWIAIPPGWSQI